MMTLNTILVSHSCFLGHASQLEPSRGRRGRLQTKQASSYGCIRSSDEWAAGQGEPRESRFDRKRRNRPATRAGKGLEATPALMHACRTQTTAGPERDSRTVDRSMPGRPLFEKSSQLSSSAALAGDPSTSASGSRAGGGQGKRGGVLESGGRAEVGWMDREQNSQNRKQQAVQQPSDDARDGSTTAPIDHRRRRQQQQQQITRRQTTQRGPDATSVPETRGMLLLQGPRRTP